jgi:hypothetical protein
MAATGELMEEEGPEGSEVSAGAAAGAEGATRRWAGRSGEELE